MGELGGILVKVSILFIIVSILLLGLSDIAYFLGLLVGGFTSLFNSFQYIGADCALIDGIKTSFIGVPIVLLIILIYKSLNN